MLSYWLYLLDVLNKEGSHIGKAHSNYQLIQELMRSGVESKASLSGNSASVTAVSQSTRENHV